MSYVNKEQIEQAKQWDLLTYLQMYEPTELIRCSRNVFSTRTHDSLKISNGKWFWWSRGIGGRSALDYLIKVRGLSFPEAVLEITGQSSIDRPYMDIQHDTIFSSNKEFELPERNDSSQRVIAYLSKRGIHRSVIDFCLESGRLYESRPYHNAVFVGFDLQGVPRYAAIRGTSTTRYMGEASGSDKRYSFSIAAQKNSQALHLFESAIDLLSYCTMERLSGADWNQAHLLSLAGIYKPSLGKVQAASPAALTQYLKACPEINLLVLHLDNDEPGRAAALDIKRLLSSQLSISNEPPRYGKDVNEMLLTYLNQRGQSR
ncbi:DUF3991 and TOPRIM domain-containing protein [Paenibacillus agaridevorans]|uniref:DUF3991 and TOPRIM domain-containing protein n=1 Tax=Paenibacillus agaridevorans TaxID=171404 RepID=UPI001BE4BD7A|nr:DUF3991 and TOPRIM domain-containing protein [Paenibacillus agaridevorans]